MSELLTFSAYATRRGWTQPYVSQLVKAGVIPVADGKKIDPVVADAAIAEHRDPAKQYTADRHAVARAEKVATPQPIQVVAAPAPVGQFHKAKTATEVFRAKNAELEYRERVGELIERKRYDRAIEDAMGPIMAALDGLAPRLGPLVTGVTDPRKVQNLIDDQVDAIRRDMETTLRAMLAGPQGTRQ